MQIKDPLNTAIVGTGYVADQYAKTFFSHPELKLVGAFDQKKEHIQGFCRVFPTREYHSLEEVLNDRSVELVINLTNPASHFDINHQCLQAGKHVYSEKPLAMTSEQARVLVDLAINQKLYLATAPCSILSATAQTMWKAIREEVVGKVRLVYANFDDGMIAPNMMPWEWRNEFGAPWPAKDEFQVGCTFEHAGYVLTWLVAFFGPVRRMTAFASCQIPNKGIAIDCMAPDFTVGCLEFDNNVVARVTCGLVAPRDKSIEVICDDGVIRTAYVRHDDSPVYVRRIPAKRMHAAFERRLNPIRRFLERFITNIPWAGEEWVFYQRYPFATVPTKAYVAKDKRVDFLRGPSEMAEAIRQGRPCRLSATLGLHIVELIETLQYPERFSMPRQIASIVDPIEPLEWR